MFRPPFCTRSDFRRPCENVGLFRPSLLQSVDCARLPWIHIFALKLITKIKERTLSQKNIQGSVSTKKKTLHQQSTRTAPGNAGPWTSAFWNPLQARTHTHEISPPNSSNNIGNHVKTSTRKTQTHHFHGALELFVCSFSIFCQGCLHHQSVAVVSKPFPAVIAEILGVTVRFVTSR